MCARNRAGLAVLLLLVSLLLIRPVPACGGVETTGEVTLTLVGRVVNTQDAGVDGPKFLDNMLPIALMGNMFR